MIHVYAMRVPPDGFERVRTELTDVYFSTLKRAGAARRAAGAWMRPRGSIMLAEILSSNCASVAAAGLPACRRLLLPVGVPAVTTDAVVIGGSIGNVDRNAPFVILRLLLVMSIIGVFATTAFVANSVLRDRETRTQELFFSTPIRKRDYVLGRFIGAFIAALAVFVPSCSG